MLLLIPIIFLAIILFYLISMTMTTNKGCRRRRRKQKECFVEYNEPTATGQIMLTDGVGNLSTFNVGTGKTLVSDGDGNITTINTGLFNNTITANAGISGTTGTFSGQLAANGGLTGSTGFFTSQLTANGGLTGNVTGNLTGNVTGNLTGNVTGNLTGNVTGNLTGNVTGNATSSSRNLITDTRSVNSPPSFYANSTGVTNELKTSSVIGLPGGGFHSLETTSPWKDNTVAFPITQIAYDGKTSKYFRSAMPADAAWGPWRLETSINENDYFAFSSVGDADTVFTGAWNKDGYNWEPLLRGGSRKGSAFTTAIDDQDASAAYIDVTVPTKLDGTKGRTAYVNYLPWSSCRYFDIFGVLSNNNEVLIKRVNAYLSKSQSSSKSNGVDSTDIHNGASIAVVPRADRFAKIRIKGVKGRIHYMGTGWGKEIVGSENGMVHGDNVYYNDPNNTGNIVTVSAMLDYLNTSVNSLNTSVNSLNTFRNNLSVTWNNSSGNNVVLAYCNNKINGDKCNVGAYSNYYKSQL